MHAASNVLYLSYDGMTDPLGQSQVIPYLRGLSQAGHRITLVSFEKPERQAERPLIAGLLADSGIRWVPLTYTKRPPVLSTLYDLWQMRRIAHLLHAEKPFDIVHCRSYVTALIGEHLQKRFGLRFVFDMRGFWADERVDGKIWNLRHPLFRVIYDFFKRKEHDWLRGADHIISLTYAAREDILRRADFRGDTLPLTVIPCCVDLDHFDPAKVAPAAVQQMRQGLDLHPGQYVLAYLGAIGTWYMLGEMLDFFVVLRRARPDAVFLLITREPAEEILSQAAARGLDPASLRIRPASRAEVPVLLSLAQASVFFILPSYSKKASSPTKQGELMAMNLPVVCNSGVGDTDRVVRQYQSGICVEEFTPEAYDAAVHQLLGWTAADLRDGARAFYGLDNGIARYQQVYASLAKPRAAP